MLSEQKEENESMGTDKDKQKAVSKDLQGMQNPGFLSAFGPRSAMGGAGDTW